MEGGGGSYALNPLFSRMTLALCFWLVVHQQMKKVKKKKRGKEEGENDVWMTHVLESLVLLFEFGIGGQQLLLGLIQVVFELLHLFLQSAHLFLRLYRNSFIKSMH